MSGDNGKQVDDALEAIRKLVEMSEQKLDDTSDIVTLDHVVWRNPVADEDHDDGELTTDNKPLPAMSASFGQAPLPPSYMTKLSKPADDKIDEAPAIQGEPKAQSEEAVIGIDADKSQAPQHTQTQDERELGKIDLPVSPSLSDEIKELDTPIGRRGGGFYQDLPKKPVLATTPPASSAPVTPAAPITPAAPAKQTARDEPIIEKPKPLPQATLTKQPQSSPSISSQHFSGQHFSGQDFSLPASEAFMTPTSLRELSEADRPLVTPDIQVPIADPPVADPAREVQNMFTEEEPEEEWAPISQPNLQLVSDSRHEEEPDEEGFSGTVRHALRSIIKEQVTSWLHQNMTDLIEDALSAPPQRPARPSSGKKQPKRRD